MAGTRTASVFKRKPACSFCSQAPGDEKQEGRVKGRIVQPLEHSSDGKLAQVISGRVVTGVACELRLGGCAEGSHVSGGFSKMTSMLLSDLHFPSSPAL